MSKHNRHHDRRAQRRGRFFPSVRPTRTPAWTFLAVLGGVALFGVIVFIAATRQKAGAEVEAAVVVAGTDVELDVAQFDDGKAHFYRYATAEGKETRFFVLKSSDGVVHAAFDTCKRCYRTRKGFRQVGEAMVCNACGKAFLSVDINVVQDQCSPVPVDRVIQDGKLIVTAAALGAGAFYY